MSGYVKPTPPHLKSGSYSHWKFGIIFSKSKLNSLAAKVGSCAARIRIRWSFKWPHHRLCLVFTFTWQSYRTLALCSRAALFMPLRSLRRSLCGRSSVCAMATPHETSHARYPSPKASQEHWSRNWSHEMWTSRDVMEVIGEWPESPQPR